MPKNERMSHTGNISKRDRAASLETIIVLATTFTLLFLFFNKKHLIIMALFFLLSGLISERLAVAISNSWLAFSHFIGNINSKIILTIIFYLFLTPMALMFRLFNRNPLNLKEDKCNKSYFHDRNYNFSKEDFEKIW